jgi:xanthine dehydrogenase accessory factor
MASAVAWRLYQARIRTIFMMETDNPLAVRREVSFCEAVHDGRQTVESVTAVLAEAVEQVPAIWQEGHLALLADPEWHTLSHIKPDVLVDAILAKRNLGTGLHEAELVIALGPGFIAGQDAHRVIETNRGHDLGRIITGGAAEPNTGIPGAIGGFTEERVLRAPREGTFIASRAIGDLVKSGETVGTVDGQGVIAKIDGVLRGLIRDDQHVVSGLKLGDIDPRCEVRFCYTISDKARAIAGSVLEAIMRKYNR